MPKVSPIFLINPESRNAPQKGKVRENKREIRIIPYPKNHLFSKITVLQKSRFFKIYFKNPTFHFSSTPHPTMHVRHILHQNNSTLLPNSHRGPRQRSFRIRLKTTQLPSALLYSNKTHNLPRCSSFPARKIRATLSPLFSHRRPMFQHHPINRKDFIFLGRLARVC